MTLNNSTLVQRAYLAWLRSELRLLPVIPIKAADRATRLPLAEVYVPLRVIERAQIEAFQRLTRGEVEPEDDYRRRSKALEQLEQSTGVFALFSPSNTEPGRQPRRSVPEPITRMLLIGDAGSGKTTTLHYGALALADAWLDGDPATVVERLEFAADPLPLPIYLRLTLVTKWLHESPEGRRCATAAQPLLDWLDQQVAAQVTEFLTLRAAQTDTPPDEPALPSPADWQAALAQTPLSALVRAGGGLLLLDGLDETGDTPRRNEMQAWIGNLAQTCPNNRYLVAARPFAGIRIAGFTERHLSPMNGAEMQALLGNWFGAAYRSDPGRLQQRSVAEEVGYLWGILERNPRLFDMCSNPLLLTSVALLVYTGVGLPRERAELYNRLVYLLLDTWRVLQLSGGRLPASQADRPVLFGESVGSVQRLLQQLAAWMQETQRREANGAEIADRLAAQYVEDMDWTEAEARTYLAGLLDSLALDSGILQRRDAGFSFAHYTLQEYLTARDYDQRPDGVEQLLARRGEPRWRETILLAVGHWATSGVTQKARTLLRGLLATSEVEALLLAGDALDDADAERVRELARLRRDATERLRRLAALTDDWVEVAHPDPQLRNRAATLLDRLDADERPGLDPTHPDYWATPIEPGTFSMGDDQGQFSNEKPQFDYTIQRRYALARFPVTNRQYLLFIQALDERGPAEAVAAARRLRELVQSHGQTPEQFLPRFWPGVRYPAGMGNQPVVGVTWYAATAFAWWADTWLHAIGVLTPAEDVRLPTEAEWERAAAYPPHLPGGDSRAGRREYPWGDWPDLTKTSPDSINVSIPANIDASKLGGTSVVGIFPHGAAACGAEDLAGNVWEWCSTPMLSYPFKHAVPAESMYTQKTKTGRSYVLRGGSWNRSRCYARCACRNADNPGYVSDFNGFRLARLFSLSSSS